MTDRRLLADLQECFPRGTAVVAGGLRGLYLVYGWTVDLCLVLRRDAVLDRVGDLVVPADMVCIPPHLVQLAQPERAPWR